MGEESPNSTVTTPTGAVFLSYASQDAEPARKICDALRAAGIEVWFDQSELRGGDAWDQKIRHQIHDCSLFMPIVSQHTQERLEGYFRLEWKLAVDRSHLMATERPFLIPVVVDGTRDREAFVPDAFRAVQWTRLPGGETPPSFVERTKRLLSPELSSLGAVSGPVPGISGQVPTSWRWKPLLLAIAAVLVLATPAYFWISRHLTPPAAFAPPPHSIAVLPFVNMSGDKEQEYFSDGLTEELLNSLAEINELQVAARTSAFSFKGTNTDIGTIARKLNVGAVLEGSVRRSGNTVRITTQLINAVTGFQVWSHTYDRDLGDVLNLETEIAGAVASALRVSLLGEMATKIELGGTRDPAAFDAYLRASRTYQTHLTEKGLKDALAGYDDAIRLDPGYALAYADRSFAAADLAANWTRGRSSYDFNNALADARRAVDLAPNLPQGHEALAAAHAWRLEFTQALHEYERALTLAPGSARVLARYGSFAVLMGRTEAGLAAARHAVQLDPLNSIAHTGLAEALLNAGQYREAITASREAKVLAPDDPYATAWLGFAYYLAGDIQSARAMCESIRDTDEFNRLFCLAMTYRRLQRSADAEAMLTKMRADWGDSSDVFYGKVYAEWGETTCALDSLETALRVRDPYLIVLRSTWFDRLRREPRFQAIVRELRFPD